MSYFVRDAAIAIVGNLASYWCFVIANTMELWNVMDKNYFAEVGLAHKGKNGKMTTIREKFSGHITSPFVHP